MRAARRGAVVARARRGEIVPVRKVDDARRRGGRGRARREGPVGRRVDERAPLVPFLDVVFGIELEIAVADGLGIRLGDGVFLFLVIRGGVRRRARRKDPRRERGGKRERAQRDGAPLPMFEIVSHKTSFLQRSPWTAPDFVTFLEHRGARAARPRNTPLYFNIKRRETQAIPHENRYDFEEMRKNFRVRTHTVRKRHPQESKGGEA